MKKETTNSCLGRLNKSEHLCLRGDSERQHANPDQADLHRIMQHSLKLYRVCLKIKHIIMCSAAEVRVLQIMSTNKTTRMETKPKKTQRRGTEFILTATETHTVYHKLSQPAVGATQTVTFILFILYLSERIHIYPSVTYISLYNVNTVLLFCTSGWKLNCMLLPDFFKSNLI